MLQLDNKDIIMPVSDPKLQATYAQLDPNPFPWRSPQWMQRDIEIEEFAKLITVEELSLTEEEWRSFSNGVSQKGVKQ